MTAAEAEPDQRRPEGGGACASVCTRPTAGTVCSASLHRPLGARHFRLLAGAKLRSRSSRFERRGGKEAGRASVSMESTLGARPKGGRVVPSRYLQNGRGASVRAEPGTPSNPAGLGSPAGRSAQAPCCGRAAAEKESRGGPAEQADTIWAAAKGPKKAASAKRPSAQLLKQESTSKTTSSVLQSTILEGHKNARPNLEFSAINAETPLVMPRSKPKPAVKDPSRKQQTPISAGAEDLSRRLESQTLLLTYASVKMEKNLALLKGKAERNLLTLLEERTRLQEEVHQKKRRLLQLKKEQELSDALDRQLEVLAPVAEQCVKFREEYQHFATALDSTRHELPLKEIHMGESQDHDLAALQGHLTATQTLLKQILREPSEHNAQVLAVVKELEAAALQLSEELPRSLATVLDISAGVSKEVSLHHQKTSEDTLGLEAMKPYYFL